MQQLIAHLKSLLSHRHLPLILALLAFVQMIWGLDEGFIMDDYVHRARQLGWLYEGSGQLSEVLNDLFAVNRTPEQLARFKKSGLVPWWAPDTLKISNWRPLAALTHWLDYRLFPHSAALMHAHSLIWLSAAVLAVSAFYRRMSGPTWIAGLAGLMYLLDENNSFPALWIANRNELIAVAFGAAALICHHRGRNEDSLKHPISTATLMLLSLLATEAGIATFAYLAAYALCLDRSPWRRRLTRLAPAFIILVFWRLVYSTLGHGTYECGAIIDPGRTPWAFVQAAFIRAPGLLMGQLGLAQPELFFTLSSRWRLLTSLISASILVLIGLLFVPVIRKDRHARFYGLGMLLSVIPICATFPSGRNFMFMAIGGFGLLAQLLAGLIAGKADLPKIRAWNGTAWSVLVGLLILAIPVASLARAVQPSMIRFMTGSTTPALPWNEMPASLADKHVLVVSAPNPLGMFYASSIRMHRGEAVPQSMHVLSPAFGTLEIERPSAASLVVRSKAPSLFTEGSGSPCHMTHMFVRLDEIFHAHWDHLVIDQPQRVGKLLVQITQAAQDGAPQEVVFSFDTPLEHESLVWLEFDWHSYRFHPFNMPQVGETRVFAGPAYFPLKQALHYVGNQIRGKAETP
jgi:hypothetical protein